MDYENKYKEALERAKKELDTCGSQDCDAARQIFRLLPELKESEDERIRKELISFLRLPHTQFVGKRNQEKWIAWLEKQKIIDVQSLRSGLLRDMAMSLVIFLDENTLGMNMSSMECKDIEHALVSSDWDKIYAYMKKKLEKQGEKPQGKTALEAIKEEKVDNQNCIKPADKVEPKFKVGDWIVNNISKDVFLIKSINNGYCTLEDINGIIYSPCLPPIEDDNHLWTIQDAKDGDVIYLPNGNNEYYLFIFKGIENAAVMSFVHFYQYDDGTSEVKGTIDKLSSVNDVFQPATKEQHDLLFAKMKEAGYEWDAEKKEMKTIEQNPTDNTESKFRVGDWILLDKPCQIVSISKHGYYIVKYYDDKETSILSKKFCETNFHLWTIEDAKDGDVLVDSYSKDVITILYKGIYKERSILAHCGWNGYDLSIKTNGFGYGGLDNTNYVPATKEQRDILEMAMADAGYTFDFEKKKLNKIKENEEYNGEDDGIDSLCHTKNILEKTLDRSKEQFLSFQIQAYLNTASDELYAKGKSLYSEERLEEIHKCMLMWQTLHNAYFYQKPAWSEEDEEEANYIADFIENLIKKEKLVSKKTMIMEEMVDWLKSLKDRYTWKPSDEQMEALRRASKNEYLTAKQYDIIVSIYDDLKKLREE